PAASETPARPAAPPAKSETPASPAPPPPAKTAATAAPVSPAKAETPAPAETTAARTEAPPAAEKPAAPEPPAIADGKPYIQAGVFSQSANAERLVRDLAAAGLLAATVPLQMGRAALFRVVIGPFGSIAARNEALQTVRKIGSADAFPVRG
ncbi:MAG TPA: SPOR domain-containing protein, partial [Thermohalobaculum sp.]|nr:SPOR domain-containing protein [Thermohalobaculum sp.]